MTLDFDYYYHFSIDFIPKYILFDLKNHRKIVITIQILFDRTRIVDNKMFVVHTEKSFRNLTKSTRNQIVFNISRLDWNQTDIRLVQNQSVHGKYNLISG